MQMVDIDDNAILASLPSCAIDTAQWPTSRTDDAWETRRPGGNTPYVIAVADYYVQLVIVMIGRHRRLVFLNLVIGAKVSTILGAIKRPC